MDTLPFLLRVLPPRGYYAAAAIMGNGTPPEHRYFETVDDLATACQQADQAGYNIFYAISSFTKRGPRKQTNVELTRVIAMDVDCGEGKPYATQVEGLRAFLKFMQDTGLPKPMVVSSGRGLHIYWILDEALTPDQWVPMATAMKALAAEKMFLIDPAVTADSARILRPTQTRNPKNNAVVDVLIDAPDVGVQELQNLLVNVKPSPVSPTTQTTPPLPQGKGFGQYRVSKIVGSLDTELPPRDPAVIIDKCKQVAWATQNQTDVPEPLWYALMGIAAYCMNPEETAKAWSEQHPDYSEVETLRKLAQWRGNTTGPATCSKFSDERPKGCDGCPLKGKITTPASIGMRYEAAELPRELPADVNPTVEMPWPFKRVAAPSGATVIAQTIDGTDIEIAPFDIYPVGYGRDQSLGYETVRYKWHRPHKGWQDLSFRQAYLVEGSREFPTSIADQGIVLGNKKQMETFQYMLRSYMDELRSVKAMTDLHNTMGWKEDDAHFVIGTRLYRKVDDTVVREDVSVASGTQRLSQSLFTCAGDVESWAKATALFDRMPAFGFSVGMGFAAPLMQFAGLKGVVLSLCGPTGSGKTLSQLWQQSIWGNPEELHFMAKFTQNALFNRLGLYNNLPMTIDEATVMADEDVGDFCYWVTQGRDKARLMRTTEEHEARTWATVVTISTNRSFASKMVSAGMETDAQMARLLEINMPEQPLFKRDSEAGRKIHRLLTTNYGVAGDVYIRHLIRIGAAELKRRYREKLDGFQKRYNVRFTGEERFWEAAFVLYELGCELAMECGLIQFNYQQVIREMLLSLDMLRRNIAENHQDAFDLVSEYLRVYAEQTLCVMHTDRMKSCLDTSRLPRGEIRARLDMYRSNHTSEFRQGTVMLVSRPFKDWLARNGYDIRTVTQEIKSMGGDATPSNKRFWFGKDTTIKAGQFYAVGVLLSHPRMAGFLRDQQPAPEDLLPGRMVVVNL